jgi:predicted MFS family arabinose efflux permease
MADVRRLVFSRALRGLVDGLVSVLLVAYLGALGIGPVRIGVLVTGTLLGSAAVTLVVGLVGHRWSRRRVLFGASLLMALTGLGFAAFSRFFPLLVVAVVGTLNPSAGDVSLFLPTEQAALAERAAGPGRTQLFAWYNLAGSWAGALGALLSGVPAWAATRTGLGLLPMYRAIFLVYAACAVAVGCVYRGLSPDIEPPTSATPLPGHGALAVSRPIVLRLAALFSLDSFGGGFVLQSLLVLWLVRRFSLPAGTLAGVFFAAGVLSAISQIVSHRLARRLGLIRTMVFTHLPSNGFLVLAAVMPTAPLAITFLLLRMAISQMDVPARQAFVMAVVPPEERAAAASVTNVPRSLAAGLSPWVAGWLVEHPLGHPHIGWPLVLGGVCKIVYDLVLYAQFRAHVPREAGVR